MRSSGIREIVASTCTSRGASARRSFRTDGYDQNTSDLFSPSNAQSFLELSLAVAAPRYPPRTQLTTPKLINKSRDHFRRFFCPSLLQSPRASFFSGANSPNGDILERNTRCTSHFLSLSTTLFCFRHFIMRGTPLIPRSFPLSFSISFSLHLSVRSPLFHPLSLSLSPFFSRTHTRTPLRFLPLPAVEKTRDTCTGNPRASEINRGRSVRFGLRRASERATSESATPWNLALVAGERSDLRRLFFFFSRTTTLRSHLLSRSRATRVTLL